ncbi:MAG: hypothetical protein HY722_09365 [Planctomycetes bacterium]|nr:hypothetical protein [Planctomycetota bacterium]
MIRINLLPEEYRSTDRAPWAMLGVSAIALAALAGVAVHLGYLYVVRLPGLEARRAALAAEVETLVPFNLEAERVHRDVQDSLARQQAILDIRAEKVFWSHKLDLLVDLVPATMWLAELELKEAAPVRARGPGGPGAPAAPEEGGTLHIVAWSKGPRVDRVARFREALLAHRGFHAGFTRISEPNSSLVAIANPQRYEAEDRTNTRFTVDLVLRPPPHSRRGSATE